MEKSKKTYWNLNLTSLWQAFQKDIDEIIVHYKTTKSKGLKPPTETVKKILDFHNWDNISRQVPYKNLTHKIKDHLEFIIMCQFVW